MAHTLRIYGPQVKTILKKYLLRVMVPTGEISDERAKRLLVSFINDQRDQALRMTTLFMIQICSVAERAGATHDWLVAMNDDDKTAHLGAPKEIELCHEEPWQRALANTLTCMDVAAEGAFHASRLGFLGDELSKAMSWFDMHFQGLSEKVDWINAKVSRGSPMSDAECEDLSRKLMGVRTRGSGTDPVNDHHLPLADWMSLRIAEPASAEPEAVEDAVA